MKSTIKTRMVIAGAVCTSLASPLLLAQGQQAPVSAGGYDYPAPAYEQPGYGYEQQYQQPAYGYEQQYAQPAYDYEQQYAQPAYDYEQQYAQPAYGYEQQYAQPSYGEAQPYQQPVYGYEQPSAQAEYGYQQQYSEPDYAYQQPLQAPGYSADPYSYYSYSKQQPYPYGQTSPYGGYGGYPGSNSFSNAPWNNFNAPDIFGENSPFEDPLQHEGNWSKEGFQPWRSGPFAYNKWKDHPATQMPWGNFPGWGKGFFGGFGPDTWEGATPWGNDVPFKWVDPTDPEESFAQIWEDALNAPNRMGRMPPGFTAPYISVPNPIDVENEFERNARNSPTEIHNMFSDQGANFGGDSDNEEKDKDKKDDKGNKDKTGEQAKNDKNDKNVDRNSWPNKGDFWK